MLSVPVDQLIFKGTHNSYSCSKGIPPDEQMDHFGVWTIELDFSILKIDGEFVAIVGHDGPSDDTCFGDDEDNPTLRGFLQRVQNALVMRQRHRPVFIHLDAKNDVWGDFPFHLPFPLVVSEAMKESAREIAFKTLKDVFLTDAMRTDEDFEAQHIPTVPELAGKAIWMRSPFFNRSTFASECIEPEKVQESITSGAKLFDDGNTCLVGGQRVGCRIFRIDQFRADWTFEFGVPPNPLVVDADAPSESIFSDDCDEDVVVHQQGTYLLPYQTVHGAVDRAKGIVTPGGNADSTRAGLGWTVLIKPGNYPGPLTIDIPLTLQKDDRFDGAVVVGR